MSAYLHPPLGAVREAVSRALAEDLGPLGDITASLVPPDAEVAAAVVSRADGVLAGRLCGAETFAAVDPSITADWLADDGDRLSAGTVVARVEGPLASVLTAERTALNFLCHLSGVATLTRLFVEAARPATVRDTRKTTPGLRALEKAAVRAGGGVNHRGNLSDAILVKDNHLGGLSIPQAVERAHQMWPGRTVQVECDTPEQVAEAVAAGAGMVLLDNMAPATVAVCVAMASGSGCGVEVSGGVTLANVASYAAAGPQWISVGALTHSAPVLDLSLDLT